MSEPQTNLIRSAVCTECGYDLTGLVPDKQRCVSCPECAHVNFPIQSNLWVAIGLQMYYTKRVHLALIALSAYILVDYYLPILPFDRFSALLSYFLFYPITWLVCLLITHRRAKTWLSHYDHTCPSALRIFSTVAHALLSVVMFIIILLIMI